MSTFSSKTISEHLGLQWPLCKAALKAQIDFNMCPQGIYLFLGTNR